MALVKPPLATVEPGRPITAQGWNAIVDALERAVRRRAGVRQRHVTVSVQADGQPVVDGVEIVAEPAGDGPPVDALPLFGTRDHLPRDRRLRRGVARERERARLCPAGHRRHRPGDLAGHRQPRARRRSSPDLFGQPLQGALAAHVARPGSTSTSSSTRSAQEISRYAGPGRVPELARARPAPRSPARSSTRPCTRMRLVVAAALHEEPIVTVPSLVGLTQAEAATALREDRAAARQDHRPQLVGPDQTRSAHVRLRSRTSSPAGRRHGGGSSRLARPRPRRADRSPRRRRILDEGGHLPRRLLARRGRHRPRPRRVVPRRPRDRADEGRHPDRSLPAPPWRAARRSTSCLPRRAPSRSTSSRASTTRSRV